MYTPRIQNEPKLTKSLVATGIFRSSPVCLADVGASGGIDCYWSVFGEDLRAAGFDPLIKEVERLNSQHVDGNQRFFPYLVGHKHSSDVPPRPVVSNPASIFERTSAARVQAITRRNYAQDYYDQTGDGSSAQEMIELDEFLLRTQPMDVDFLKIDTDGSDYQVLLGARELLQSCPVMGVAVECQFHGPVNDQANTFSNIDRLLRQLGFSLFDMEVYRYSRAVLAKPFVYRIPAQTTTGQVLWADALYFRDAGVGNYEAMHSVPLSQQKILKLACFFEIFGLEDCSAELLLKYRGTLADLINVEACLDLITPQLDGQRISYHHYVDRFEREPYSFFPPA